MSNFQNCLSEIRKHLDRIEAADAADLLTVDTQSMLGGLLGSFESRLENVKGFVPDVKPETEVA